MGSTKKQNGEVVDIVMDEMDLWNEGRLTNILGSDAQLDSVYTNVINSAMEEWLAKEYGTVEKGLENSGIQDVINSAYRSTEKQKELYEKLPKGMAAKPGTSLHEKGRAVDIATGNYFHKWLVNNMDKYGLDRPYKSEPWHFELKDKSLYDKE